MIRNIFLHTLMFLLVFPSISFAEKGTLFNEIIVFGDSLSANGSIKEKFGIPYPPSPPYYKYRYSNGPVYAEYLPKLLEVDVKNFSDFAIGGAQSGKGNNEGAQFPVLQNEGVFTQRDAYLASKPKASPEDLFIVYAGANDYFSFVQKLQIPTQKDVDHVVSNLLQSARLLSQQAQAQQIVLPNLPSLGNIPLLNSNPFLSVIANRLTLMHNTTLAYRAAELARDSSLAPLVYIVDIQSLFDDIEASPKKYNLDNVKKACLKTPSCAQNPSEANRYLFFDDVHPTGPVHKIAGAFFADTFIAPRTLPALSLYGADHALAFERTLTGFASDESFDPYKGGKSWFADARYFYGDRHSIAPFTLGFKHKTYTISGGFKKAVNKIFTLGIAGGLSEGEADYVAGRGKFDVRSSQIGIFTQAMTKNYLLRLSLSASYYGYDIKRYTHVVSQIARAQTEGAAMSGSVEGRLRFKKGSVHIEPLARARLSYASIDSYQEEGAAGLDMIVDSFSVKPSYFEGGAQIYGSFSPRFQWRMEGVYVRPLHDDSQHIKSFLVSVPQVPRLFKTRGDKKSYGRFEGALSYALAPHTKVELSGAALIGHSRQKNWNLGMRFKRNF